MPNKRINAVKYACALNQNFIEFYTDGSNIVAGIYNKISRELLHKARFFFSILGLIVLCFK